MHFKLYACAQQKIFLKFKSVLHAYSFPERINVVMNYELLDWEQYCS